MKNAYEKRRENLKKWMAGFLKSYLSPSMINRIKVTHVLSYNMEVIDMVRLASKQGTVSCLFTDRGIDAERIILDLLSNILQDNEEEILDWIADPDDKEDWVLEAALTKEVSGCRYEFPDKETNWKKVWKDFQVNELIFCDHILITLRKTKVNEFRIIRIQCF